MSIFSEKSLNELLQKYDEDSIQAVLSSFVCNENQEVEEFLKHKAINHEKKGLAKTVLILDPNCNYEIVGYYSISIKSLIIEGTLNTTQKKKYFGTSQTNGNTIPAILIGQLGKNEAVKSTFTGSNLIDFIIMYIKRMSLYTPSVIVYVEHNGTQKLFDFYEKHGFIYFPRNNEELLHGLYCHLIKTDDFISKV